MSSASRARAPVTTLRSVGIPKIIDLAAQVPEVTMICLSFMIALDSTTPWFRLVLHTPLTTLAIFVIVSLLLRENYPFSHFPMYSSPTARRSYYIVTDSGGQPLPISTLTGVTPPKIGKMHRRKSQERDPGPGSAGEDSSGANKEIGREICEMLRQQATRRGQTLPPGIQLFRVEIRYHDGKINETKELLFAE
jgi:hypothetical protein